jgi:hypothetical protein
MWEGKGGFHEVYPLRPHARHCLDADVSGEPLKRVMGGGEAPYDRRQRQAEPAAPPLRESGQRPPKSTRVLIHECMGSR